jgi:hypothetical protein
MDILSNGHNSTIVANGDNGGLMATMAMDRQWLTIVPN